MTIIPPKQNPISPYELLEINKMAKHWKEEYLRLRSERYKIKYDANMLLNR